MNTDSRRGASLSEADLRELGEQRRQRHLHLQAGQGRAQAGVRSVAERQVPGPRLGGVETPPHPRRTAQRRGWPPGEQHRFRRGSCGRRSVRPRLRTGTAASPRCWTGATPLRSHPPTRSIRPQVRQLIGVRQQRLHRIGKRRGRGLKPGSDQEPQGVAQPASLSACALVRGCDEGRGEVLARSGACPQSVRRGRRPTPPAWQCTSSGEDGERRVDHLPHAAVVALGVSNSAPNTRMDSG